MKIKTFGERCGVLSMGIYWMAMPAVADVKLPAIFGDNMVLQRGTAIPVWGTADPGENVTVTAGGSKASAITDAAGHWRLKLPALPVTPKGAVTSPLEMTIAAKNSIAFHNVLPGEVWICSGQSNMEVDMRFVHNSGQEIKAAKYPQLRIFIVQRAASDTAATDVAGHWVECSPETVGSLSGTAYYFGRDLHQALGVPVGILQTAWAGSYIESWISDPVLSKDPDFPAIQARWQKGVAHYPAAKAAFEVQHADYEKALDQAKADKKPLPREPMAPIHSSAAGTPLGPETTALIFDQTVDHYALAHPSALFNGMVAPLIPFAIKGVLWYQGESNFIRTEQYKRLLPLMITNWRQIWGQGDFPFVYVQIPNIGKKLDGPLPPQMGQWPELREAQASGLTQPNTAMVPTLDLGDGDIHPQTKAAIGERLSNAARALAYGEKVPYSGPIYDSMTVAVNAIRLKFKGDTAGLAGRGGEPLRGFAIAGSDKKWVWGQAVVEGVTIVVSSDTITAPVAVRYAWEGNPIGNAVNGAGLPVSTFRTDDWPLLGTGKK